MLLPVIVLELIVEAKCFYILGVKEEKCIIGIFLIKILSRISILSNLSLQRSLIVQAIIWL